MQEQIQIKHFREIDLNDLFFNSLKESYDGFSEWFNKKAEHEAYVQYDSQNKLQAFLYLKIEDGILDDITPNRPSAKRLKVGTFKIDAHNTKLGERFIKKITDYAIVKAVKEIYLTIYPKQIGLITLLNKYGFVKQGYKKGEDVLIKNMITLTGDHLFDYPLISLKDNHKYLLSIMPRFHTRLFPDSILNNERRDKAELIKDVSYTNSIHKIYISFIAQTRVLKKGDLIAIYRTSDIAGHARFRSIVTSICKVEEVRFKSDFENFDDFIKYTKEYSIFDDDELKKCYMTRSFLCVIKMTYNIALNKRITNGYLIDNIGLHPEYWGFFKLKDDQFKEILRIGEINENIIIN